MPQRPTGTVTFLFTDIEEDDRKGPGVIDAERQRRQPRGQAPVPGCR